MHCIVTYILHHNNNNHNNKYGAMCSMSLNWPLLNDKWNYPTNFRLSWHRLNYKTWCMQIWCIVNYYLVMTNKIDHNQRCSCHSFFAQFSLYKVNWVTCCVCNKIADQFYRLSTIFASLCKICTNYTITN